MSSTNFCRFDLLRFDGQNIEPWIVEVWVDVVEMLFENLYIVKGSSAPDSALFGGRCSLLVEGSIE